MSIDVYDDDHELSLKKTFPASHRNLQPELIRAPDRFNDDLIPDLYDILQELRVFLVSRPILQSIRIPAQFSAIQHIHSPFFNIISL